MSEASPAPRWRALDRVERRVVGVLAEKAKTTPENYPLTLNSLVNGANQKSNRFPQMTLDEDQVSAALDSLRHAGAVSLVQGDGRVDKFRHLLYDWLAVDKAELAVMTELLLRGAQSVGDLRGRAARMEPFKDIGELLPVVDRLRQKGLLIYLTPSGRGAVVTHNLYQPQELAKVRAEHSGSGGGDEAPPAHGASSAQGMPAASIVAPGSAVTLPPVASAPRADAVPAEVRRELDALREQLASLRRELVELKEQLGR